MVSYVFVNLGSGNGLVPEGTKPLLESRLTYHQWGPMVFIWGQLQCTRYIISVKYMWKLHALNINHICQESNICFTLYMHQQYLLTHTSKHASGADKWHLHNYLHANILIISCLANCYTCNSCYGFFLSLSHNLVAALSVTYSQQWKLKYLSSAAPKNNYLFLCSTAFCIHLQSGKYPFEISTVWLSCHMLWWKHNNILWC